MVRSDSGVACVAVRFARGYTPRIHLKVVAELPENGKLHTGAWRYPLVRSILVEATGSAVCFTQVKATGVSPVHFALAEITGRRISRGSIQG